jgi:succinyl-CoA synthetase beta subunit
MNLHEYQAKQLFSEYGIPVPAGRAVHTVPEAIAAARELGGGRWVVKAQVHSGGRGKAGGVKLVGERQELEDTVQALLGTRLVTHQSGPKGLPISTLLVERATPYTRELYLGALLDRTRSRIVFMASAAGGMEIEEVAAEHPEQILRVVVDPVVGLQPYQCRRIAFGLALDAKQAAQLARIMLALYRLYTEKDVSLVEINPLVVLEGGELLALDAKINLDGNALYRQPLLDSWRDASQEDPREHEAQQFGLNYISLDGNIACMVNGAGLAMATMDLIKLHGGEPANFLDVGGGTTADKVAEAFKIILSEPKVKAILVNIFGGIVRCDLIAEGIIKAVEQVSVNIPVVVRLEGTNVELGREMLEKSGFDITIAEDLTAAARKAVAAAA